MNSIDPRQFIVSASHETSRIAYLDVMKAVGIVLVVVGHAPGFPESVLNFIYTFHMPVFFFVSGYLVSDKKLALPILKYIHAQATALLIPYIAYYLLSLAMWGVVGRNSPSNRHTMADAASGVVYASADRLFINPPLWFFVSLFVTSVIYFLIRRTFGVLTALVICTVISVITVHSLPLMCGELPWCLEISAVAVCFYASGAAFRVYQPCGNGRSVDLIPRSASLVASALLFVGVGYIASINGRVNLFRQAFGPYPSLYYVGAIAGTLGLLLLALSIPDTPLIRWLSRNSIVIFPMHTPLFVLFGAIGFKLFKLPSGFAAGSWLWGVAYSLAALVLCWPISLVLQRVAPRAFGLASR